MSRQNNSLCRKWLLVCLLLLSNNIFSSLGFSAPRKSPAKQQYQYIKPPSTSRPTVSALFAAEVSITAPTQEEAEQMGIREWPQQAKSKGTFTESSKDGQTLTRYILDGTGRVQVDDKVPLAVKPGDVLEVTGEGKLTWEVLSDEMVLLTPGFEQVGLFAGVAVGLVLLLAALFATTS